MGDHSLVLHIRTMNPSYTLLSQHHSVDSSPSAWLPRVQPTQAIASALPSLHRKPLFEALDNMAIFMRLTSVVSKEGRDGNTAEQVRMNVGMIRLYTSSSCATAKTHHKHRRCVRQKGQLDRLFHVSVRHSVSPYDSPMFITHKWRRLYLAKVLH